jgi:sugar phosphate permease
MITFLAAWVGIITALTIGALPLFMIATIVAGIAQGISISAAIRGLLYGSAPSERAPIFAVVYILSYMSATIPSLISAQLSHVYSLLQIAIGYGALALIAALVTVIAARNPHTEPNESPERGQGS